MARFVVLAGLAALLFASGASAQPSMAGCPATAPCSVTTAPATTTIQGTLAVSTSSIALSTGSFLKVSDGTSASLVMPPPSLGLITIKNNGDSTAAVRICFWGNSPACTSGATSNGKIIEAGASTTVSLTGSVSPNVICDAATACHLSITE